ncbi:sce7726 family protein [Sodalis ligni]|uniref:sce7726 family protein n=1 Tax=Sodalis ligni TaxID=2697027 RepID=UPI001BDEF1E2|nr:sce7726 family protein [Sodalis ligni]QWA11099.1 sce7726 family protein [Sodalis ligni]
MTFEKSIREYKGEYYYKNLIAKKIFLKNHIDSNATVVSELRVGNNKADLVIVNGHSVCYEIKTERDTLKRLPDQIKTFDKIFDRVYVVCSQNHIKNVLKITPENVGVFELSQKGALKEIKKASNNLGIDRSLMISSLRKNEYVYIAEKISGHVLVSSNMDTFSECLAIFENSPSCDLKSSIVKP